MQIKTIRQAKDLKEKKILLRVDFNVPFNKGEISDNFKIKSSILTILFLLRQQCKIIIISHITANNSLRKVAIELQSILKNTSGKIFTGKVNFINDCCGFKVEEKIANTDYEDITILENIRNYPEETKNSYNFAKRLSRLADIYVNNAFAVCHRSHASIDAIKRFLPSYGGLLLEREVSNLNKIINPEKPFVVIMGGIKLETKIPILAKLYKNANYMLLGGAIANSFLKLIGNETGVSKINNKNTKLLKNKLTSKDKQKIITPIDAIIRTYDKHTGETILKKDIKDIQAYDKILDIGPETIKLYSKIIKKAKTIVWNGPMGKFENNKFKHGTLAIGKSIAARSNGIAFGVVGGGETIEALHQTKMSEYIDWISTGGGAMLAYLSQKEMPGLKGLTIKSYSKK